MKFSGRNVGASTSAVGSVGWRAIRVGASARAGIGGAAVHRGHSAAGVLQSEEAYELGSHPTWDAGDDEGTMRGRR